MLLHDAIQPFYTYRTRAADLQRPFQTASATFSNGRWKRTTALKIPRESWTKRELERRTRYHYLAVVYPRLVSRSKVTLLRSPLLAKQTADRQIADLGTGCEKPSFTWCKIRPEALVGMIREDFQYLVTSRARVRFAFSRLHLGFIFHIYRNSKVAFLTFPLNQTFSRILKVLK